MVPHLCNQWLVDNHRGRSQWFHVFSRHWASRKAWQVRDSQRSTKYHPQEHQSEAPMLLHHLYSLQVIGFGRFSRPQLFFPLPGGKFPFAEGNMWQLWFRMKSMGFNVLCLSHGLPKAQNSDLKKTPESAVLHQKHQSSSVVRRKRAYTWEKGCWEGSNVKWLPFCWLLLVLTQMSHFVHSGQNVRQGRKPSPNGWCIFFMFSQGILAQLVWFSYNSLSNGVILLSFPTVLKYSMCWLSQLNESEFIYKLLCFDFFFFSFLCSSLLCLKDRKLFVEGKTYKQCDRVQ